MHLTQDDPHGHRIRGHLAQDEASGEKSEKSLTLFINLHGSGAWPKSATAVNLPKGNAATRLEDLKSPGVAKAVNSWSKVVSVVAIP